MKSDNLAVRPIISLREADKLVWTLIYHGNHSHYEAMKGSPKHAIERWFAENGEPLSKVIARCRSYFDTAAPFVENLVGSTWTFISEGENAKASMTKGGKEVPEIELEGPGTLGVDYQAKFESACRYRDKAIDEASLEELHTAIIKGIASIESYISHRVDIWNRSIEGQFALIDTKTARIPFEEKIKKWIPLMTDGKKLDLAGRMWEDFLYLQGIRDNDAVHAKQFAQGTTFSGLALSLNRFKLGIADFLLQLHIIFDEAAPRSVIRARFFPEIYVPVKPKTYPAV